MRYCIFLCRVILYVSCEVDYFEKTTIFNSCPDLKASLDEIVFIFDFFRACWYVRYSKKVCSTKSTQRHVLHMGFGSLHIGRECVSLVWPMRILVTMISSYLVFGVLTAFVTNSSASWLSRMPIWDGIHMNSMISWGLCFGC